MYRNTDAYQTVGFGPVISVQVVFEKLRYDESRSARGSSQRSRQKLIMSASDRLYLRRRTFSPRRKAAVLEANGAIYTPLRTPCLSKSPWSPKCSNAVRTIRIL